MSRLASLDYLRGFAALSVALPHFVMLTFPEETVGKVISILAVEQFFVLSGFVLASQMLHCLNARSHWETLIFLVRRWMRTIPPYLFALGIVALLTTQLDQRILAKFAFYVQNLFQPMSKNSDFFPVAWSLSVEEWFYLVFAAFLFAARTLGIGKKGFVGLTIFFVIIITLVRLVYGDMLNWDAAVRRITAFRMDSIAYGFLLFVVLDLQKQNIRTTPNVFLIPLFIFMAFAAYVTGWKAAVESKLYWQHAYPVVSSLFAIVTIVTLIRNESPIQQLKPVKEVGFFLGKVSYTVYLFHLPIAMVLRPLISDWSMFLQIAIFTAILIAFASAFYFSFEAPILAQRPKYREISADHAAESVAPRQPIVRLPPIHWPGLLKSGVTLLVCALFIAAADRAQQLDSPIGFYSALVGFAVSLLVFFRLSGLWKSALARTVTLSILIFALILPVADYCLKTLRVGNSTQDVSPVYSFRQASADPLAFARWWAEFSGAWQKTAVPIQAKDQSGKLPFVTVPNTRSRFFGSPIRINNFGFRGSDIAADKKGAYRIFALGESPTFGTMIGEKDPSWPEALAKIISDELVCRQNIEVVNAGTVGYTIEHNIERIKRDIIALKPDMMISYHGYNSFRLIDTDLNSLPSPPTRRQRGSLLLSEFRFYLRLAAYNRALDKLRSKPPSAYSDRHQKLYQEFARLAQAAGAKPVIATLSLAVNHQSPDDVRNFYGRVFMPIQRILPAIKEHNRQVLALAGADGIHVVDTTPGLDGRWDDDYFYDIVHLTNSGTSKLAHNIYSGIEPVLISAGCSKRVTP